MCHRRKNMGNLKTLSCIWFFGGIEFPEYVLVSCICWFLFSAASGKSTHCLSSLPERGVCRLTISAGKKKKTKRRKKKRRKKEEEVAGSPSRQDPVYFPPSWQDRPLNAFQLETLLPPQSVHLMMIVSKYKTGMDLLKIPLGHGS